VQIAFLQRHHPSAEQLNTGAAIHGSLEGLQSVDLSLGLPVAPRLGHSVPHRLQVLAYHLRKTLRRVDARRARIDQPSVQPLRRSTAKQTSKPHRQAPHRCELGGRGFQRIAAPNSVMMGHCQIYTCAIDQGLDNMRKGLEIAGRIGNRHGQMFATQSLGFCLTVTGCYSEAPEFTTKALEQARDLNARRYEAVILAMCAELALSQGLRSEALSLARAGRDISDATGPGFAGPLILGLLALAEDRREEREAALAAGEALLGKGAVGHNHFWFRRCAIESALLLEDWDEAERQADVLLGRMAEEPLAYASCLATRARVLARRGRGDATDADEKELEQTQAIAAAAGVRFDALGIALRRTRGPQGAAVASL
jgi:hypothetical protein